MNKKAFTLIELLAVVVIIAILALIAIPQIMKILSTSRKSTAIDSTQGIAKATENYIYNLMAKNEGSFPKGEIIFECSNSVCELTQESKTLLENYEYKEKLEIKQNNIKQGTITITERGKKFKIENLKTNGFTCEYIDNKANCN